jgi:hypothetical protein
MSSRQMPRRLKRVLDTTLDLSDGLSTRMVSSSRALAPGSRLDRAMHDTTTNLAAGLPFSDAESRFARLRGLGCKCEIE